MNAMRRELAEQLPHYGDMQRFFKPLAVRLAASVAEVEVAYRPRRAGSSKYDFLSLVDLFFDFVSNFSRRLFQRVAVVGLLLFGAGMLEGWRTCCCGSRLPCSRPPGTGSRRCCCWLFCSG